MQARLNKLVKLLNEYPIEDLNRIYREKEVELEIASFTKHPDVRWSEPLKKKMIQRAKRKKISDGRKKYIVNLIHEINSFKYEKYFESAIFDLVNIFDSIENQKITNNEIELIHIEFSSYHKNSYIHLYGSFTENWWDNEIAGFEANIESSEFWNILETNKFYRISELLEIIEIEDEEYPRVFEEIYELRVNELIKMALQSKIIKQRIKLLKCKKLKIEIGMHDCEFYSIFDYNETFEKKRSKQ